MHRLKVVRSCNWKREPGWRWTCNEIETHPGGGVISGFSAEDGFTVRLRARGLSPVPPAQARAMTGARRHLIKYHGEESVSESVTHAELAKMLHGAVEDLDILLGPGVAELAPGTITLAESARRIVREVAELLED